MTSRSISILTQTFFVSAIAVAVANCQETKIKFQDLPPAVQHAAKAASQGAVVKGYAKEIEKGKTEYEVQLVINGKARDVSIDPEGKVLETESEVDFASLPAAAKQAIEQAAAGGKVEKVEEVKSDKGVVYEALVHKGGKKHEIRVLENGEKAPAEN